jgi:hypothetical protein
MPHLYRFSALVTALARMWRGWRIIVPVIIVNAFVQAFLQWPPFSYETGWLTALTALLSAVMLGFAFACVAIAALHVTNGPVRWVTIRQTLRATGRAYALWSLAWLVVVLIGTLLHPIGGLVVAGLLPFLLLAALDSAPNPLLANFRAIGRRFWRWLLTSLIVGIGLILGGIVSGFFVFFIRPPTAPLISWLVGGFLASWVTTAWALIYRSATQSPS